MVFVCCCMVVACCLGVCMAFVGFFVDFMVLQIVLATAVGDAGGSHNTMTLYFNLTFVWLLYGFV